ncbi:NAD(P)-dependent dehydrogenase (short-subunit alcohol dehydrogenase family) [Streptomyces sp. 840.1]|uniref:oxidoreductase n=1 Tax=Streptomyces sp. 840.1 TaxID=2485152 RepID=UPI000F49BCC4|nr:oxidoreductase [Streptomyces sp. 840.1]ROQ63373.1 NAD(P)-dependent dehydrogenase (short-subunit alcohol dehydrogenase family) [Streptomyces sp. 840.1]
MATESSRVPGTSGELAGRRAVVTGGSRGIGAAIARNLLDAGATVVTSARGQNPHTPPGAAFVAADLSTPDGVRGFADTALELLGGVDIIVNNAGGCRSFQSVLELENDWQYTMDINFLAAVRLNAALVPTMRESGGAIVHVSSIATVAAYPNLLHYAAAKSALETYSRGLSAELAPDGIRVVSVCLGNVETPASEIARTRIVEQHGGDPDDLTGQWAAEIPLGRLGDPQDIADAVSFLVSPRASWITGSNVVIDGGKTASLC